MDGADASHQRFRFSIVDVSTVPRQQVVDAVEGTYCNVDSIVDRLLRQRTLGQQDYG